MSGGFYAANPYEQTRSGWNTDHIETYLPLVKRVAGRLSIALPAHVDEDDLIGYGVFGLLDALEKFDPARGVKFETYASLRIRGAILDGLRAMDWVPHSARQRVRQVQDAFLALEGQLGRPAGTDEVARFLGMKVKDVEEVLKQGQMLVLTSFDELVNGEDGETNLAPLQNLTDQAASEAFETIEQEERQRLLAEAIGKLPDKEQLVLALYYQEELTLKEIAKVLSLSESRISQLHSQAIARLRGRLSRRKKELL